MDEYTDRILEKIRLEAGVDAQKLVAEHDSVIYRCIAKLFSEYSVPVDTVKLDLVFSAVKNGSGKVNLKPSVYASVKNSVLTIQEEETQEYFEFPLEVGKEIQVFNNKSIALNNEKDTCSKNVNQNLLKKYIDCDKIV